MAQRRNWDSANRQTAMQKHGIETVNTIIDKNGRPYTNHHKKPAVDQIARLTSQSGGTPKKPEKSGR